MKKISLKECITILANCLINGECPPEFYLKDGDGGIHRISEADLFRDRFQCEDGYWDCYDWCDDGRLLMEDDDE